MTSNIILSAKEFSETSSTACHQAERRFTIQPTITTALPYQLQLLYHQQNQHVLQTKSHSDDPVKDQSIQSIVVDSLGGNETVG